MGSPETPEFNAAPPEAQTAPLPGVSLAHAELLMRMMETHRIDEVDFGGIIKMKKSFHLPPPEPAVPKRSEEPTEDQLLFYSAK